MLGIIDYGVGNLFSLSASLKFLGAETAVSDDKSVLKSCDRLILPGVGAFGDAAKKLALSGLDGFLKERAAAGVPILGICLGMQLLFKASYEYGRHAGLGLIDGEILPLAENKLTCGLKIPHIGWNKLKVKADCPIAEGCDGKFFYYVHSYYAEGSGDFCAASSSYGAEVAGIVYDKRNVYGTQFHPEKSGGAGLLLLKKFLEIKSEVIL